MLYILRLTVQPTRYCCALFVNPYHIELSLRNIIFQSGRKYFKFVLVLDMDKFVLHIWFHAPFTEWQLWITLRNGLWLLNHYFYLFDQKHSSCMSQNLQIPFPRLRDLKVALGDVSSLQGPTIYIAAALFYRQQFEKISQNPTHRTDM